jgi:hypothetical protein
MEIATQKKEIIDWILSIEDQTVLNEIEILKKQTSFDFDEDPSDCELAEQFKKGLTTEQFRTAIKDRIKSYNWKK